MIHLSDYPSPIFPWHPEQYVEDIIRWAVPPVGDTPLPIYWMKSPAGVGKSAVAQTCVEKLKRLGKPCPAFFFSINGRNKHQKFFPSIAYQLATINTDYNDLVDKKICRDKTLVDETIETQFWDLIFMFSPCANWRKEERELEEGSRSSSMGLTNAKARMHNVKLLKLLPLQSVTLPPLYAGCSSVDPKPILKPPSPGPVFPSSMIRLCSRFLATPMEMLNCTSGLG